MKRPFFLLLFILPFILPAQQDSLMIYYRSGLAAYEKEAYDEFYSCFKRANELRPGNPTLIYNLACASALTGRADQAFARLKEFLLMNAHHNIQDENDFKILWDDPRFMDLVELQIDLSDTVRSSKQFFSLENQGFHPESITYCSKDQSFFFGDIRSRRIIQTDERGSMSEWKANVEHMYAVMGIVLKEQEHELWAVTAALPEMLNYNDSTHQGKSSLFVFDINSRELKTKWLFEDKVMGGITKGPKGDVLISDLKNNQIFQITDSNSNPKLYKDLSDHFFNLQGMTFNDNGTVLYLSDYITGLYYLDHNLTLQTILPPKNVSYKGIDGLYYHKGHLYATQNGTRPMRLYRFELDPGGTRISEGNLIDQGGILNEPTTGTFTTDQFLYIANSPWGAYDKERNFKPEGPVVILSQPLK